jgi:CRISPR-associated endonuclease/helicase Cas3
MNFNAFFVAATHAQTPFDYQLRLADAKECRSLLINVPTGLGKTAAVLLAWLWHRLRSQIATLKQPWPRRLVYCLPMRTLVEQTASEVTKWLQNLQAKANELGLNDDQQKQLEWLIKNSPVILMGGEEKDREKAEWDIHPEKPCILIGTQDMLLSRALNRGYGMSRYRWPMHFGLLNEDTLWVMDETQLMGVAVETSAQLDAFRQSPMRAQAYTWWMSATLDEAQLSTVDHPKPAAGWQTVELEDADLQIPAVHARVEARKTLTRAPFSLQGNDKKDCAKLLAEFVLKEHKPDSLTLVVVNRVARAQEIYERLLKSGRSPDQIALIHSRYRPVDRARHEALLNQTGDRLVIATQAVEAGVDISARLLITELAPWSSLVQRFGRCNRRGEFDAAEVAWVDLALKDEKDDLAWPYSFASLEKARSALQAIQDVGPNSLQSISVPPDEVIRPVIRRKDLLDLFDTTPDLCGNDLDVSRYIRDGNDTDVQVFWREFGDDPNTPETTQPSRDELCRVAVGQFRTFAEKLEKSKSPIYIWNSLDEKWQPSNKHVRAGAVYLLHKDSGGYSNDFGWTGNPKHRTEPLEESLEANDGYNRNKQTFIGKWVTLKNHTADVLEQAKHLSAQLSLSANESTALQTAALWHDIGKAHSVFQEMLLSDESNRKSELWAKSAGTGGKPNRKAFRHELASALVWLALAPKNASECDLVAYLIAAHHGKVRLSIRSMPNEDPPPDPDRLFARGIWHNEEFPAVNIGALIVPAVKLDLSIMQMGEGPSGPSWLARTIALRSRFGPFRLAYLETALRAADARASSIEQLESNQL